MTVPDGDSEGREDEGTLVGWKVFTTVGASVSPC